MQSGERHNKDIIRKGDFRGRVPSLRMVVIRRQNAAENYQDLKQPTTVSPNGQLSKVLPKLSQERSSRKWPFSKISSAGKHAVLLSFYVFHCYVTAMVLLCLFAFLSPLLAVYNVLRFIEKKLVHLSTGANAMTGQDALWLQDSEKNRMIINSVMVLEGTTEGTVDKLRAALDRCVAMKNDTGELTYPRLTKHIRRGNFQYFLEETENFDIAHQVFEYDGERPKSREEMEELLSRLVSEDIRHDIPPWRFLVIHKGLYADGEALVLFRMHHGLADGVSLTRFLAHVLPDQEVPFRPPVKFSNISRMLVTIRTLLVGPKIILGKLFSSADRSILHGPQITGVKRVSWSEPIDLQVIKRIKNQTGTTVNDVMVACLSMTLHDYFKSQGITDPPDVTASVPVDVRFQEREMKFENNFAIVSLKLPVSEKDILQQLYSTKANMDEVKWSGEAFVMATAANYTVEFVPAFITNIWNKPIANIHSMVLSNVPGPTTPLTIAGHKTKELFFWPPQRDLVGIGVGMYSYNGKVIIGVQGDVNCLCKPQLIVKGFEAKIAEMEKRVFNSTSQTELVDSGIETESH